MALPSQGAIRLGKYLVTVPNAEFAKQIGVSAMTVSHWKNFTNVPRGWHRVKIQKITDIEPEAWDRPAASEDVNRVISELEARGQRRGAAATNRAESIRKELGAQ